MKSNWLIYKGIKWIMYHNVLMPDEAPHKKIRLTNRDTKFLLKTTGAYFIRWTTEFDSKKNYPFWYVIKDEKEDLSKYKKDIRKLIRRGLKRNTILKIENLKDLERYGELMFICHKEAYKRYYGPSLMVQVQLEDFLNKIQEILTNNLGTIWIALHNDTGEVSAYRISRFFSTREGLVVGNSVLKIHPKFSRDYASYAIIYESNRYHLNELNALYVFDGARNILHKTKYYDMAINYFRYRKAHAKLNIAYSPLIGLITKILYPYRRYIRMFESLHLVALKLNAFLKQEEIRRDCDRIGRTNR